jgi:hypothetical protein
MVECKEWTLPILVDSIRQRTYTRELNDIGQWRDINKENMNNSDFYGIYGILLT